ncbi:hypothetical protein [Zoogloea sp. LCSB751]|uniref:hypothetical protein n=1 Tax=Zoogloea sp. LCSB751 TaxID=1965277 RepID=UPI0009A47B1C|nr:hypothetical protein [Zoogloea sp. LCSB751]
MPTSSSPRPSYALSTAEFARQAGVTPEAIRRALSEKGSYFGAVPIRRPNGRFLWPSASPEVRPSQS